MLVKTEIEKLASLFEHHYYRLKHEIKLINVDEFVTFNLNE